LLSLPDCGHDPEGSVDWSGSVDSPAVFAVLALPLFKEAATELAMVRDAGYDRTTALHRTKCPL
jgi:hypothetical protein